jgi:hypothetical protein
MLVVGSPLFALCGLTNTTWLIMWSVLTMLTIGLVVLVRTRWSANRTWRMCAVLSLWVHVLIVVFSMTVRIVTGPPAPGDGGPIRVAVIPAEPLAPITEKLESEKIKPVWEEPSAPPLVAPAAEPLIKESEPKHESTADSAAMAALIDPFAFSQPSPLALEAPDLLAAPVENPEQLEEESLETDSEPDDQIVADEKADQVDLPSDASSSTNPEHTFPDVVPTTPVSTKSTEAIPELYADRFAEDLTELASERGGSSQTEGAVKSALSWLAVNQSKNGGWDASKFGAGEERVVLGHDRQGAGANADTGVTGLAVLAFLGSGNSHLHGSYRNEVAGALEFLRQRQRADGSLFGEAELYARMYCHSMATLAACEAYAMTRDRRLDPMCRAAVSYSLAMQHPADGGWRYRRGDTGDTSQLGWVLMVLKSAELAGIDVPDVTWTRAERFLRRVKRGDHGGLAAYRPDGPPSRTMTAEAWFCHQLLQADRGGSINPSAIREAVSSLKQELPSPSNRNLYYWYYATLAMQQNVRNSPEDTESWDSWNHALTTALIATQESDGSWDANTVWGGYGGKVYTTSLSALCLEVYYRYNPTSDDRELADRDGWQSIQR